MRNSHSERFNPRETQADYSVTPELSGGEHLSAAAFDELTRQQDELQARRCPHIGNCGNYVRSMQHIKNPQRWGNKPSYCKKFVCPYCLRKWMLKNLKRTAKAFCFLDSECKELRDGNLHFRFAPAEQWESIRKSIERHTSEERCVGRCFTRKEVLIVASEPFPGSTEADVLAVASLMADAIQNARHRKFAFMLLYGWNDVEVKEKEWEAPIHHRRTLAETAKLAKSLGATTAVSGAGTLYLKFEDAVASAKFKAALQACPSLAMGNYNSLCPESDRVNARHSGFHAPEDEEGKRGRRWIPPDGSEGIRPAA